MSINILHTADWHLGAEFRFLKNRSIHLKEEVFKSFEKFVSYALDPDNKIDIVIIAGDLFDTHNPETRLKERVKEELSEIVRHNIKLVLLPGNHDSFGYNNSVYKTDVFPGIVIKNTSFDYVTTFELNGQKVLLYGGVYEPGRGRERMLEKFKIRESDGIHIGVLHGTLDRKDIDIKNRDLPFSYDEFKNTGLNYLALGHFHSFYVIESDKKHKAAYPGSIVATKINEYGDKYCLLVKINDSAEIEIEKLRFSKITAEYRELDINKENINTYDELIMKIKKFADKNKILTLKITGIANFSVNEEELFERIENDFFFIKIESNVRYIDSSIISQFKDEETIRGIYFRKLIENYHKAKDSVERRKIENAINFGLQKFIE